MSTLTEFLRFLGKRKKLWLVPLILFLLTVGGLLLLAQGSVFAPFVYTLF
jgi:hypothetical protein